MERCIFEYSQKKGKIKGSFFWVFSTSRFCSEVFSTEVQPPFLIFIRKETFCEHKSPLRSFWHYAANQSNFYGKIVGFLLRRTISQALKVVSIVEKTYFFRHCVTFFQNVSLVKGCLPFHFKNIGSFFELEGSLLGLFVTMTRFPNRKNVKNFFRKWVF